MAKVILWLLFVRALSMWYEREKRKMFHTFVAEKIDFITELKPRVNIRSQAVNDAKAS